MGGEHVLKMRVTSELRQIEHLSLSGSICSYRGKDWFCSGQSLRVPDFCKLVTDRRGMQRGREASMAAQG